MSFLSKGELKSLRSVSEDSRAVYVFSTKLRADSSGFAYYPNSGNDEYLDAIQGDMAGLYTRDGELNREAIKERIQTMVEAGEITKADARKIRPLFGL